MTYTTLLFDLDNTLLDSDESLRTAFVQTMAAFGASAGDPYQSAFDRINDVLWEQVERGEISPNVVRTQRFQELVAETDLDADPYAMADHHVAGLGANGDLYEGARTVLDELAQRATLGMVTNGIGEVQRTRIDRLELNDYFGSIVISAEVGASKPGTAIFDIAFDQLGNPTKDSVLMIGDSLTSDIQGGVNYGIDTCWYNPSSNSPKHDVTPTHQITSLRELTRFVS